MSKKFKPNNKDQVPQWSSSSEGVENEELVIVIGENKKSPKKVVS
jgi:hypothetical protein